MTQWRYLATRSRGTGDILVQVLARKGEQWEQIGTVKHVVRHSPDGVQMGYGGSGPADMALSILVHFFRRSSKVGEAEAIALAEPHYQAFKWAFVAPATERLDITSETIKRWLAARDAIDDYNALCSERR